MWKLHTETSSENTILLDILILEIKAMWQFSGAKKRKCFLTGCYELLHIILNR